jgi:hypothetical protein
MRSALLAVALTLAVAVPDAQAQTMPDPRTIAGVPLPDAKLAPGTIAVRVIRGSFANNLGGVDVQFVSGGRTRTVKTDASGRAESAGFAAGSTVRAIAVVEGERLESQDLVVGTTGIRVVLVATDPELALKAEEDKKLASGPPVRGTVVLGPETRVVAEYSNDSLNIFYVIEIVNTARTRVDIGGPVLIDLPREARGASVEKTSSSQATANGPRITIVGPFAPGSTMVQVGFEMPYSGPTVRFAQTFPIALQRVIVLATQIGGLQLRSPQLAEQREVDLQGQVVIAGSGPGLPPGQPLTIEIAGLPYHARWPRYTALSLAGAIMLTGLWAAYGPRRRPRAA